MLTYGWAAFRALGGPLLAELVGLFVGIAVAATLLFGPRGIAVEALAAALAGSTSAGAVAALAWAMATGPALAVIFFARHLDYLRWLPGRRGTLIAVQLGAAAAAHLPWLVLWGRGLGGGLGLGAVAAPLAAGLGGSALIGWLVSRSAVAAPVPERRWAALGWATAVALLRPGLSILIRSLALAVLGGAVLGTLSHGAPPPAATAWGVISVVAVLTLPALSRLIVKDARARGWLMRALGVGPLPLRLAAAGSAALIGAGLAAAVMGGAAVVGGWSLAGGTAETAAVGLALGAVLGAGATLLQYDSEANDGARAIAVGCGLGLLAWWSLSAVGGPAVLGGAGLVVLLVTRAPKERS